jgi:hypothetical protein
LRAVLLLVTVAIVLTFVGGVGWIACAVAEADAPRIVFQYVLYGALGTTFASLAAALVVGLWHLYLYLFTRRRPVSLFASESRDEEPSAAATPAVKNGPAS